MKQKHRKALYYIIAVLIVMLTLPIWIFGFVANWIIDKIVNASNILKYLLRVYDEDPKPDKQ